MSEKEFEDTVTRAIANIPPPFSDKLGEINFVIEDEPSLEKRQKLGLRKCDALFGLYEGVPLTKRGGQVFSKVPDVITIFKHPMVDIYTDLKKLEAQIYETVWHEVAHFYGLDHQRIHSLKNKST